MQLNAPARFSPLRARLGAAACALMATGLPAAAHADGGATNTLDASALFYGEQSRTKVIEPIVRVTRLFADGQSFSGQLALDVMTGASPTGAMVTNQVQTTTTPSGQTQTVQTGQTPLASFSDMRIAFDGDWTRPIGRYLTPTIGGHISHEKDYASLGVNGKLSVEAMQKLTTLTVGGGLNSDQVSPVSPRLPRGGSTGTGDNSIAATSSIGTQPKHVANGVVGVSRILSRRWMMGVNFSRTHEGGFLTEPYKVVSVIDGNSGDPVGSIAESRPSVRNRQDVLASSVYHFTRDVLYLNYRYYWDDWQVKSNTFDIKYRRELDNDIYVQPHVRYYAQSQASFFTFGLRSDEPTPTFASSDYRLGPLRSVTAGATVGFKLTGTPGEWTVRAEYIRQYGDGYPATAIGAEQNVNLFPPVNIGSLVVGYSLGF